MPEATMTDGWNAEEVARKCYEIALEGLRKSGVCGSRGLVSWDELSEEERRWQIEMLRLTHEGIALETDND